MIKQYSHYSIAALRAELQNVKHIMREVNTMQKPDNFTYIDVLNLYNYLEVIADELTELIDSKKVDNN